MDASDLEVHGEWPRLRGQVCDALIADQYWHEGKLCEPANVVWLQVGPIWHRLVIDCGVVFWRRSDAGPAPYEMPELGAEVRLKDIGHETGLIGGLIDDVVGIAIPGGAEVRIALRSGPTLTFRNLDDHTVYYTG
jgi:hypothetical protein